MVERANLKDNLERIDVDVQNNRSKDADDQRGNEINVKTAKVQKSRKGEGHILESWRLWKKMVNSARTVKYMENKYYWTGNNIDPRTRNCRSHLGNVRYASELIS